MNYFVAEFIGTCLLVLLGNGVVANVLLQKTKGHGAGWIVITAGWSVAVYVGAFCASPFSGAHLNPAITVAMAAGGKLEQMDRLPFYLLAQMLGAMFGAGLVYLHYRAHFRASPDSDAKLGCFCTSPNLPGVGQALLCEMIGTFVLTLPIFLIESPSLTGLGAEANAQPVLGLGSLGLIPVALIVFGIGLSLGGTTGYAINPARDLGPRLMHALLPIPGKRDSQWSYAWVPVVGPILGAVAAAFVYRWISL